MMPITKILNDDKLPLVSFFNSWRLASLGFPERTLKYRLGEKLCKTMVELSPVKVYITKNAPKACPFQLDLLSDHCFMIMES